MWKLIRRSVLAHKVRFALTAFSIVLGVGFVASTYIYTDTINEAFAGIFDDAFAGIDVQVSSESEFSFADPPLIDEAVVDIVAGVPGVDRAIPSLTRIGVQFIDDEGEPVSSGGAPNIGAHYPAEVGMGFAGFEIEEPGRPPSAPGEVLIGASTAKDLDLGIGDSVDIISTVSQAQPFTIVGIVTFGGLDNLGGSTFALFDLPTTQQLVGAEGQVDGVSVLATPGQDADALVVAIQQVLPEGVVAQSAQDAAEADAADTQEALAFFGTFLSTFGFIALFVGTFIIANTFRIVVAQRTRELALLRALGATARQIRQLVFGEALLVGIVASVIGVFAGLGLAVVLQQILDGVGVTLPTTTLKLQPRTVILGLIVGIVVTVVSTWLPARRAARISPMEALHESETTVGSLRTRGIAGASVLGFGFLVLFLGLFTNVEPGPFSSILLVGLGAGVILIGVTILAPLVARPVLRVIGWPFAKMFRVAGTIARENARKTPRRTSATAGAIMIGIALVALAAVMAASIRGTIDSIIDDGIQADLFVQPENQFQFTSFTPELGDRIAEDEGVADTTRLIQGVALVDESEEFIAAIEDDFVEFITFDSLVGTFPLSRNGVAVDKGTADGEDYVLGDQIAMTFTDNETETLVIEAIYESPGASGYAVTIETFAAHNPGVGDSQIYIKLAPGADLLATQERLVALAEDVPTVEILTLEELRSLAEDQINGLLNFITGLLGLAVVISLFGVTNTMTLSVYERTHEIGLLRAVGMTRRQTRRMIRTEASIISVFGAVLGIGVGIFFGWSLVQALADEGFDTFVIPYATLAIWILVIGVLGIVFALIPAWRASRLNVLEAISYE